jgi:prepilin-type N-terminal cleavage/methylation domain-containing protein
MKNYSSSFVTRRAFTLIELIIVILIISLVGFMVFAEVKKQEEKADKVTPLTLRSTLKKSFGEYHEDIEFFCIQKSKDCYVARGSEILPYEGLINLGDEVEVYMLDRHDQMVKIDEFGRIKDEKITFRYHLYANGSTTKMVISNSEGIYFLPSYFGKSQQVESLDDAKELWVDPAYDLTDSGNYY